MKNSHLRLCGLLVALYLSALWTPLGARAQEQPPPATSATSAPDAAPAAPQEEPKASRYEPSGGLGGSWADTYFRQIGSAGLLAGDPQGLKWGRFYIPDAAVIGVIDRQTGSSSAPDDTASRELFRTTIVYDRLFHRNRLALQYQPQLALADGHVIKDFSNQNTSLSMIVYAKPRLSVRVNDYFQYFYTQQAGAGGFLDADFSTFSTAQNLFLTGPERLLYNNLSSAISYALSARSSLTITPTYTYIVSGIGNDRIRGQLYGGGVDYTYRTSAQQLVGITYSYEWIHRGFNTGGTSDTQFHTIAGLIERRLSPSWFVKGSLGVTVPTGGDNGSQPLFAYGNASLVKQFIRSTAALTYSRGDSFASGFVSGQFADRIDITYTRQISRRFRGTAGAGYLREVGSSAFQAKYASGGLDFLLAPRAGLFLTTSYSRRHQATNSLNLFSGNLDLFTFGLRWNPSRANSMN